EVETETNVSVAIDRDRFEEELTNLLDNAAKFSPPEGPIRVRAFRNGPSDGEDSASVEVIDAGPGIPPEQRVSVFGRFSRSRPPGDEEVSVAVLGLFIGAAPIKAHGGRIDIEEGPGQGTMLRLTVPLGG